MKFLLPLSLLATLMAAHAFADCTAPTADVKIPNGAKATMDDMLAAKRAIKENDDAVKAYAGIWILKDVIERAGSLDKEKLRDTFATIEITSGPAMVLPTDKIKFDASGQLAPQHIAIQVQKGAFRTVWPDNVASSPLDVTKTKQGMVVP